MADMRPPLKGKSLWLQAEPAEQAVPQTLINGFAHACRLDEFPAHVTLHTLFDASDLQQRIVRTAKTIACHIPPLSLEVMGVGMRKRFFQSVFMTCVLSPALLRAHELVAEYFGVREAEPYMPHWSIVYGDLDHEVKQAIAQKVLKALPKAPILINCLSVVDMSGGPADWRIVEEIPLTGH